MKLFSGCIFAILLWVLIPHPWLYAGEGGDDGALWDVFAPVEFNGFVEFRGGMRTQYDPYEKDISVMEARAQVEFFTYTDWAEFKYKGDGWADGVLERFEYDTREAFVFSRPLDFLDVKVGRQILTWGTGDLVFLNDLFPKDWQSFFIGRDSEYLKAPSDAVKASLFLTDMANVDLVYTPKFDPDRYVNGDYLSYWSGALNRIVGRDSIVVADTPDSWFKDDEIAVRIYQNISSYELALYGYWGFWKNPAGETTSGIALFPGLRVYGASARGNVGPGIGNMELAYYDSIDDPNGANPLIRNSEIRYLVGYAQEIARDFSGSLQYYVEQMLDYDAYKDGLKGSPAKDHLRHVITLQLTKLLMNQNLELSLNAYFSPSDQDAYLMPKIHYKYSDRIGLELGANIFFGSDDHTFFAQFQDNTNVYAAIRYSF